MNYIVLSVFPTIIAGAIFFTFRFEFPVFLGMVTGFHITTLAEEIKTMRDGGYYTGMEYIIFIPAWFFAILVAIFLKIALHDSKFNNYFIKYFLGLFLTLTTQALFVYLIEQIIR